MKIKRRFLVGTIVGGAVGSIVGMMVAPKTGKQTRADLARNGAKLGTGILKTGTSAKTSLLRMITRPKKKPASRNEGQK